MKKQCLGQELKTEDIQKISYEILKEFKTFCEMHQLRYFMAYGTLLGAVRHEGFIPWDDDIDVFMPRPDYEKLLQLYKDNESYQLYSPRKQKEYCCGYMKLVNSNTYHYIPDGTFCRRGVDIDIFALDGQPDDIIEANKNFEKVFKKYERYCLRLIRYRYNTENGMLNLFKRLFARVMISSGIISKFAAYYDKRYSYYDYDVANYVGPSNANLSGPFEFYEKGLFGSGVQLKFENEEFIAPIKYDRVLSLYFGEYMKLPPEDKRKSTHVERYYLIRKTGN